jgi:hypothetical protein
MLRRLVTVAIGTFCALIVGLPSVDIAVAGAQAVMQGPQGPQGRGMPRDQPPGERKGMGAIRGRVTALDTGRPLRRARINVNARAATDASRSPTCRLVTTRPRSCAADIFVSVMGRSVRVIHRDEWKWPTVRSSPTSTSCCRG